MSRAGERLPSLVGDEADVEHWGEGLELFHNPRAKIPVPPGFFPDIVEHRLTADLIESRAPYAAPRWSVTAKFATPDGTSYSDDEPFRHLAEATRLRLAHEGVTAEAEVFAALQRGPTV